MRTTKRLPEVPLSVQEPSHPLYLGLTPLLVRPENVFTAYRIAFRCRIGLYAEIENPQKESEFRSIGFQRIHSLKGKTREVVKEVDIQITGQTRRQAFPDLLDIYVGVSLIKKPIDLTMRRPPTLGTKVIQNKL
jgi:hypothetical protein